MKAVNLSDVKEAGDNLRLPAGGYVCKYTDVTDVSDKNYLLMEFDIVEGDFKGYYADLASRAGFWGGTCYRSYKEAALPMFKRMCSAVSKSNTGFIFDGGQQNADEKTLVGKLVGIILGEEEYIGNDGSLKTRLRVSYETDVDSIRKGSFKVPQIKRLPDDQRPKTIEGVNAFVQIDDDTAEEVPF